MVAARPLPGNENGWCVLATGKPYGELGADYFARRQDPERETRRLIAKLEALGHRVTLDNPAA